MKRWLLFLGGIIILIILLIGIYFSPIGAYFLKNHLKEKICFSDKFKITYFNHAINSFSATLSSNKGFIQIFGTFIPFDISYNAQLNDIGILYDKLKGNFNSTGEATQDNDKYLIKGDFIYARGYGNLDLECQNNRVKGTIFGKNFDTKKLLQNIKNFKFPLFHNIPLDGQNTLRVNIQNQLNINSFFKGTININEIDVPLNVKLNLDILKNNSYAFNTEFNSSSFYGEMNGLKNGHLTINGKLRSFDLKLIRKNILYPVVGRANLDIKYDDESKIFNFKSSDFNGYSDGNSINIQLNMLIKNFFRYLNLPNFLNGHISGNIIIDKNHGVFNLLIEDAAFISNKLLKKIDKIVKFKLENVKSIFFLNGKFDSQKVEFDFISKNPHYYIYLKKGVYYYEGLYDLNFELRIKNNIYKFNISNGEIKLLDHVYKDSRYKTLVY